MTAECAAPATARAEPLLVDREGHTECLLGNEAIARGAIEAGVAFACGYPGTPSSEVTDTFARIAPTADLGFEYSVNEKVALEMAFAASLAGARSLCAMKHLGLMAAGDPLSTIPYIGVEGGMVIVSAGDPSCRTSPNEQDQRYLGAMLHVPVLDPSTPQEAHAMTRFAYDLSEQSRLPVILRVTTRVCHSRAVISYGPLRPRNRTAFTPSPARHVPIPINARRMRLELPERLRVARELLAGSGFLRSTGATGAPAAIIASGAPAAVCEDLLRDSGLLDEVALVTVGTIHPLPTDELLALLRNHRRVLVLEELSPYLEDSLLALSARHGLQVDVLGKHTGHLPEAFEYEPHVVMQALHEGLGLGRAPPARPTPAAVPPRPPTLCPGCPHRATYFAARAAFDAEQLFFNDIGCYTLGYGPPLDTAHALLCMGAGFTLAAGVSRVTGKRTVGVLGDSTFFHSGMPPLLNAIKEGVNMVAVILDNQVTAMTGFQQSPSDEQGHGASIEAVVRALGAEHVEILDPYDVACAIAAFQRARDHAGVSVVIAHRPCPVFEARRRRAPPSTRTYEVDASRCRTCSREPLGLRCDARPTAAFQRQLGRGRASCAGVAAPNATEGEAGSAAQSCSASASCSEACPLGLCIQGLAGQVAAGQYDDALSAIMRRIPLPESVCRVCHRPCEAACLRAHIDAPVAVNDLKRFVVEWGVQRQAPYDPPREPTCGKRVAIVGAGPSGLAAAHELALRGYDVALMDANAEPGGLLRTGIPPFRLPRQALDRDIQRVLGLGVQFDGNAVLGGNLRLRQLFEAGAQAVYVAVGAHQPMGLDLPAEQPDEGPAVLQALDYLSQANAAAEERNRLDGAGTQHVVVVGGGNAAIDAARTARRLGAAEVTVAYRRTRQEMPALTEEIHAAEQEGVQLRTGVIPSRLRSDGVVCVRTRPGPLDATGRARPVVEPDSEHLLRADQVIVAIGQTPADALLHPDDLPLERNDDGTLWVDPSTGATSDPLIFTGGDATAGPRTVTDAIAAGLRAAWAIDRTLRGPEQADRRAVPPRPPPSSARPPDATGSPLEEAGPRHGAPPPSARQHPAELDPALRVQCFEEVVAPLTERQAHAEAARCMACGLCGNCRVCIDAFGCPAFAVAEGRVSIDAALCNGCGVCQALCPNGAIRARSEP